MRPPASLICCLLALVVCSPVAAAVSPSLPATDSPAPTAAPAPTGESVPTAADALPPDAKSVSIAAVYPDPVAGGDRGEFVVLSVPPDTALGEYRLTDGDGTATLPNATATGRVVASTAPNHTRRFTDSRVVGLDGHLALANGGDRIRLLRGDRTVDSVRYSEAIEGDLGVVNGSVVRWRPLGATDRPVLSAPGGEVRAFALPDAPGAPLGPIRSADERVLLAGYTFASRRVATALERAAERGVEVRVLLSSAWYVEDENRRLVEHLREIATREDLPLQAKLADPGGDYEKIHAKGVVIDGDQVLLGSLNWNEGAATENREVLLAVEDESVADFYARAYAADWRGGGVHLPVGILGGLATAVAGAGAVARREVSFA